MKLRNSTATVLLVMAAGMAMPVFSAEPPVYGSQLMTEQERIEHRQKMRDAKNEQERALIRKQHHERMKVRARERGVELPDEPPMRGGKGMGSGMGQGQGGGMGKTSR